ncbi:MAG TPA: hypothetical protein VJ810_40850 [Blastocatellia bacterium]|nr:hypothetical protein [Blastocatellia bacterium]
MRNGQCFLPRPGSYARVIISREYFTKVNDKVANLISEVIRKWDMAGL